MKSEVVIVGGGLTGALLGILLARRGIRVVVYERRPSALTEQHEEGRSINLALSTRGIHALKLVGLSEKVLSEAIAMRGRFIHAVNGATSLIPYSRNPSEVINSVSRRKLNIVLLESLMAESNATVYFDSRCIGYDLRSRQLTIKDEKTEKITQVVANVVFGTDGAASAVRMAMMNNMRMNYSQDFLEHGYKELTIPPTGDGGFALEPNALHIWPRGGFMMIALPNADKSFTCTLFYPHEGQKSFSALREPATVEQFFLDTFPDAVHLIPTLTRDFFRNPTAGLVTVRCTPWYYKDQVLLLGDAAHAIVPFFGQGMNCAFEDCTVLDRLLELHADRWEKVFSIFHELRKPNTDAIAQLALDNFIEMRDTSGDPRFALKRQVEHLLEERFPGKFISKYGMVTFSQIPYSEAFSKGALQDQVLMEACSKAKSANEIDLDGVFAKIQTEANKSWN